MHFLQAKFCEPQMNLRKLENHLMSLR